MIPYWILFFVPAFLALDRGVTQITASYFFLSWIVLTLVIGLRTDVGADWNQYTIIFDRVGEVSTSEALRLGGGDFGYQFLMWFILCCNIFFWSSILLL